MARHVGEKGNTSLPVFLALWEDFWRMETRIGALV
jgi:hypothetical protein